MSGYTKFAVVGAGSIGSYIIQQLLKDKAAGIVKEVIVLTRQVWYLSNNHVVHDVLSTPSAVDTKGSKTTVQGDAKVIQVDYSNEASIKYALTGVDVVISTVPMTVLDVQEKIAAAAKQVDVKLFVPSEYGGVTEGATEGIPGAKANIQGKLKALGMPYAAFYTGPWADFAWKSYVS
jgi:saccharopine dehydrogenase-like NADP-dependent oxidoreductase